MRDRTHTLLLVRNGVSHDARVLRAARVAERTFGGGTLVVGVATASAPSGRTTVEGVQVLRLPTHTRTPTVKAVNVKAVKKAKRVDAKALEAKALDAKALEAKAVDAKALDAKAQEAKAVDAPTSHNTARSRDRPFALRSATAQLGFRARAGRILSGARFAWQALALARRERPALVHANDWNTMWCGVAIKLTCGARLIYDSHELWPDRNGRWERRWWLLVSEALFVRVADALLTASPGYADAISRRYRVERPTVIRNIPDVVNGHTLAEGARRTASQPQTPPLAIYIGGLMPGRGLEQTIDALPLAPALRLRAIGPGSSTYRASLLARAAANGVADRIELEPAVPPAMVPAVLAGATAGLCLIQPTCRSYELTLPNKLFEYAAAGVPVLAGDLPVIGSVVREWGLGEVVPPTDPRAIAAGLIRLCADAAWSAAAARSRAFAASQTWEREALSLRTVYAHALCGGERAGRFEARTSASADSPFFHSAP